MAANSPTQNTTTSANNIQEKGRDAIDQVIRLATNSPLGGFLNGLNLGVKQSSEERAIDSVFDDMAAKSKNADQADVDKHGMRHFDGSAASIEHNWRVQLQEMFDQKRIFFDDDPVKSRAEFQRLLDEVDEIVASGKQAEGVYDASIMSKNMVQKVKELGASLVIRIEEKVPPPVPRVESSDITYGQKLQVNANDPASVAAIGLKNQKFEVYDIKNKQMVTLDGDPVSSRHIQQALGDNYTVQAFNIKHNDPVDLPKGATVPPDGFYFSNDKGVGYYIGAGDVSIANTKIDISFKPEQTAAPALTTPAPGADPALLAAAQNQNQPVIGR